MKYNTSFQLYNETLGVLGIWQKDNLFSGIWVEGQFTLYFQGSGEQAKTSWVLWSRHQELGEDILGSWGERSFFQGAGS